MSTETSDKQLIGRGSSPRGTAGLGELCMAPRILHVIDSLEVGGMETVLVNLTKGLARRGLAQTVCTLRHAGPLARCLSQDIQLVELHSGGRDWSLRSKLRAVADRFEPDVVHGQNCSTWCDIVRAFAQRVPILQTFHGFLPERTHLHRRVLGRWMVNRTQQLSAVSSVLQLELSGRLGIAANRIGVIGNGVDTRRFRPGQRGPAERDIRRLTGGKVVCVTIASLTRAKSPETLVRAARELPDEIVFAWVGAGPLENEIRRLIQSEGLGHRFHLMGPLSDVRAFLRAGDIFVLPSVTEAMPMSVLEAMATGLPVVATRVGDLPEMMASADIGLLADPEDASGLASRIRKLAYDAQRRERMGRAARESAAASFGLASMTDGYVSAYESLLVSRHAVGAGG